MRCISLWQPYATLIVIGVKKYETRFWQNGYLGPLLIHASDKTNHSLRELYEKAPFKTALRDAGYATYEDLPRGAIIGKTDVVDYLTTTDALKVIDADEVALGNYAPNRWAWKLGDRPVRFNRPIKHRGAQKWLDIPDELVADQLG